jgi:hypothetical protein
MAGAIRRLSKPPGRRPTWLLRHERASSENGTPGPVNTDHDHVPR